MLWSDGTGLDPTESGGQDMNDLNGRVRSHICHLDLPDKVLCDLALDFAATYEHLALNSTDQFLATPVKLPTGNETGLFLAIDVGGTNLRVCFIELLGKGAPSTNVKLAHEHSWPIDHHLKSDHADDLFKWIGSCIIEVINAKNKEDGCKLEQLPVGITFSFPMKQHAIGEATLMAMGKGFTLPSNLDLRALVQNGYNFRRDKAKGALPPMRIIAITNDTVATLAASVYSAMTIPDGRVAMGLIVGTGTNATIPFRLKHLHESKTEPLTLPGADNDEDTIIIVNTEWTIRGAAGPLEKFGVTTTWDAQLDSQCEVPGFQPFEYMTSGRYLGELTRLVVYDVFTCLLDVDRANLPQGLCTRNSLTTTILSKFVAPTTDFEVLAQYLQSELPAPNPHHWVWTSESAETLSYVAKRVQLRASRLIAAAVIGLLITAGELVPNLANHIKPLSEEQIELGTNLLVAYTGGVIAQYPSYLQDCQSAIDHLFEHVTYHPSVKGVKLHPANDGSVIGAGVIAGTVRSFVT